MFVYIVFFLLSKPLPTTFRCFSLPASPQVLVACVSQLKLVGSSATRFGYRPGQGIYPLFVDTTKKAHNGGKCDIFLGPSYSTGSGLLNNCTRFLNNNGLPHLTTHQRIHNLQTTVNITTTHLHLLQHHFDGVDCHCSFHLSLRF